MRIVYQHFEPATVLYARAFGPYSVSAAQAWKTMGAWLDRHNARSRMRVSYGLFHDDPTRTPPELLRYDACILPIADLDIEESAGVGRQHLPGGAYAVHTHVGGFEGTGRIFSVMRRTAVASRGLTVDFGRPFMRVYQTDPVVTPSMRRRTAVCVPVLPIRLPAAGNDRERSAEITALRMPYSKPRLAG